MTRRFAGVAIGGLLPAVSIIRGGALVPDTGLYAQGHAWWSSPLLAVAGALGGRVAVDAVAIAAAFALGELVAVRAGWWGCLILVVVEMTPVGAALYCAGADAAGAFAVALLAERRGRFRVAGLAALFHLVAGLELLVARAVGRLDRVLVVVAAVGAIVALPVIGRIDGSRQPTQAQLRYLLPAIAYLVVRGLPGRDAGQAGGGVGAAIEAGRPTRRRILGGALDSP